MNEGRGRRGSLDGVHETETNGRGDPMADTMCALIQCGALRYLRLVAQYYNDEQILKKSEEQLR